MARTGMKIFLMSVVVALIVVVLGLARPSSVKAEGFSEVGGIGAVTLDPEPTPEPAPAPEPTPTPEPTPEPQPEPAPTPTPEPTPEPAPAPEPQPTPTVDPVVVPEVVPTVDPVVVPEVTPVVEPTPAPTVEEPTVVPTNVEAPVQVQAAAAAAVEAEDADDMARYEPSYYWNTYVPIVEETPAEEADEEGRQSIDARAIIFPMIGAAALLLLILLAFAGKYSVEKYDAEKDEWQEEHRSIRIRKAAKQLDDLETGRGVRIRARHRDDEDAQKDIVFLRANEESAPGATRRELEVLYSELGFVQAA